jgi:RibD C-terminal domain
MRETKVVDRERRWPTRLISCSAATPTRPSPPTGPTARCRPPPAQQCDQARRLLHPEVGRVAQLAAARRPAGRIAGHDHAPGRGVRVDDLEAAGWGAGLEQPLAVAEDDRERLDVNALKAQDGPEIQVQGSANLIQSLHADGLIDEFNVPHARGDQARLVRPGRARPSRRAGRLKASPPGGFHAREPSGRKLLYARIARATTAPAEVPGFCPTQRRAGAPSGAPGLLLCLDATAATPDRRVPSNRGSRARSLLVTGPGESSRRPRSGVAEMA